MIEGALWRALLLFLVHLSFSKEESYEATAFPVKEIPVRNTWNSLEKYEHDQGLPRHRPHMEFLPVYKESQPTHKKLKKVKKIKLIEETTTKRSKKKRKTVRHKNGKGSKVKKKFKGKLDDKRKPFDITVHIKMDDT